jgi:glutamyl endopeptidase
MPAKQRKRFSPQSPGDPSLPPPTTSASEVNGFVNRRVSKPKVAAPPGGEAEIAPGGAAAVRGETELGLPPPTTPEAKPADEGPLLDAWHASFSTSVTIALLKKRDGGPEFMPEMVFLDDDRKQVTDTRQFPWKCICSLLITAADGTHWVGSGWLAGPRTVITAGHCVFLHGRGGWAQKVEVYPGRNGGDTSPGSFTSTNLKSVTGWTNQKSALFDYGAILLDAPTGLGFFAYGVYDTPALHGLTVNVFGYPADKPQGTLWGTARRLTDVLPQKLVYNASTYGGQSGSPVFEKKGNQRTVLGIHNYGDVSGNSATRITDAVFDDLDAWKSEAP